VSCWRDVLGMGEPGRKGGANMPEENPGLRKVHRAGVATSADRWVVLIQSDRGALFRRHNAEPTFRPGSGGNAAEGFPFLYQPQVSEPATDLLPRQARLPSLSSCVPVDELGLL
jgi:hypothetical protein